MSYFENVQPRQQQQQSTNMSGPSSSWRGLASGAASKARAYLAGSSSSRPTTPSNDQPAKQSWEQWARQKISRTRSVDDAAAAAGVEQVSLFPGWANRQYATQQQRPVSQDAVPEFALEVSVSGYATALRPPEFASRTERTLMRIARGFAALPKLPQASPSPSVQGSPRLEAADARSSPVSSRKNGTLLPTTEEPHDDDFTASSESRSSSPDLADLPRVSTSTSDDLTFIGANVALLHANLDSRLRPFWAQPLANRIVRLSLFLQHRDDSEEPLFVQDVLTSPQGGAFNVRFKVPFERICTHPRGVHLAFGGMEQHQHVVLVHAHLLPPPPRQQQVMVNVESSEKPLPLPPPARIEAEMNIPLGAAGVRVISDIDDTVKSSEVLGGVRSMFRNVFVRPLEQVVIHSMSDWYQAMHSRGVRFHYVSNGPFELLSVLRDFITVAGLPPGSLRLRYYQTRSMFNWLSWEPAGERKRAGVVELLEAFPSSQFILIGDTGEHDLELYASLAAERPGQILAIYVRDVTTSGGQPLADPAPRPRQTLDSPLTAAQLHAFKSTSDLTDTPVQQVATTTTQPTGPAPMTAQMQRSPSMNIGGATSTRRPPQRSMTGPERLQEESILPLTPQPAVPNVSGTLTPGRVSRSSTLDFPGALDSPTTPTAGLTPAERRRAELQARVDRARDITPRHIVLRIFREPEECAEVWEVLDKADKQAGD